MTRTLHFSPEEFAARRKRLGDELDARRLDGLLVFAQESMYWLTGYDTFGFCFFQCLYITADGETHLLTRSADLRQARHTSTIEDVRIWPDGDGVNPAVFLRDMLESLGARGQRLGIETETVGLTYANGVRIEGALAGFCVTEEASDIIPRLRAVKSAAEITYARRAGELADQALDAGLAATGPGADEGDILAAMQGAVFRGGGDYPGNEFIIGSGADALLCRYKSGRRKLDAQDQLTLEFAGVYRHYHAALMRTVIIGEPSPEHVAMHRVVTEALEAVEAALRPGCTAGEVFAAHARTIDDAGFGAHRLKACGYSLGARFTPSWMDPPMFYAGQEWTLEANMIMFAHMIVMDSDTGTAMSLGRTYLLTGGSPLSLSSAALDLVVKKG